MVIPKELFREDSHIGYRYAYFSNHPLANKSGKVYEHRYVAWLHNNFFLPEGCHVHHIDFNKLNNTPDNLLVMDAEDHVRLHCEPSQLVEELCVNCGKTFQIYTSRLTRSISGKVCCSQKCFSLSRRKFEIDKETLFDLVWSMPTVEVAEMFGVSDQAISKRCKKLGISKPPRGYWAKVKYSK